MAHVLFGDTTQAGLHTVRRALERGHTVTLVRGMAVRYYAEDEDFHALLDGVDRVVEIEDSFDADALTVAIREAHAWRPVDAVVGSFDLMLEALATACARLGFAFTSAAGIRNARDKGRARHLLAQVGLASARFAVARDAAAAVRAADEIGYPVVVKPVGGTDSIMASRAERSAEVRAAAEGIFAAATGEDTPETVRRTLAGGVIVEEYLDGELVSAELGRRAGQSWPLLVTGRSRAADNDCIEMGAVLPAPLPAERSAACFGYAEAVCRALGLDIGVFHVEMMITHDGPVLVEANPRPMGGVMAWLYTILTGTNFCDYQLDIHLGREPRPVAVPQGRTITARRLMPSEAVRLADDLDTAALDRAVTGLPSFENFLLKPGAAAQRQDVLGRYAVLGDTWHAAMTRADELIPHFEEILRVSLIRPEPVHAR